MQLNFNNISFDFITELYRNSEEIFILLNNDNNILFLNNSGKNLFGSINSLKEIEHNFTFDVCILDKEKFFQYNPIQEALSTDIIFRAETLFQISSNLYRNLNMRSFVKDDAKILIFADITEKIQNSALKNLSEINEKLEKENKEFSELREKAETLAIRTGLVNKISRKIKESFDIEEIINTVVKEITETLGLSHGYYEENKSVNITTVSSTIETQSSAQGTKFKLVTPVVYHKEIFGILSFFPASSMQKWHAEEINLIEGLASQLGLAINQAKLFIELEKQKHDLEKALKELQDAQTRLIQSEKMASLGQLVAGVAHEINTPIGSLNSNNDIFIKCLDKIKNHNTDIAGYLEIIEDTVKINSEAIKRINSIVKALKNFARLDESEYKEVDIHDGIKSTLMLINHETKGKIQIIEAFEKLPLIKCYPNQLNQVFMNILINACQSIEKNGEIKISTYIEGSKAIIIIADNGKGIPEYNLNKIFDPGFTTKGVGVGTGLGLSICYQIIEKHKGSLKVESTLNKGSKFTIELPL